MDLCQGPHLHDTGRIGAFKLLSVAGAYWRGESTQPDADPALRDRVLPTQAELDAYLARIELAKAATIGGSAASSSCSTSTTRVPGSRSACPRAWSIVNEIQAAVRAELDRLGYQEIRTPMILSEELWKSSGHWDHYHDNMYFTEVEERGIGSSR